MFLYACGHLVCATGPSWPVVAASLYFGEVIIDKTPEAKKQVHGDRRRVWVEFKADSK